MFNSKEGTKLNNYFKFHHDRFLQLYSEARNGGEEDVHEFRVTIKKLKGVFKFVELISDDFNYKKNFSPLKKLFKPAGKIREIQVNLKRLKDFENTELLLSEKYECFATKTVDSFKRKLFESFNSYNPEAGLNKSGTKIQKICKGFSRITFYEKAYEFIKFRIIKIKELAGLAKDNQELVHEIRIQLKEISAILGLLNTIRPKQITTDSLKTLKSFEDKIGLWHDYVILRLSLIDLCIPENSKCSNIVNVNEIIKAIEDKENAFLATLDDFVKDVLACIQPSITYLLNKIEKLSQTSEFWG